MVSKSGHKALLLKVKSMDGEKTEGAGADTPGTQDTAEVGV